MICKGDQIGNVYKLFRFPFIYFKFIRKWNMKKIMVIFLFLLLFVCNCLSRPHMYLPCQAPFVCKILVCSCKTILVGLYEVWLIICVFDTWTLSRRQYIRKTIGMIARLLSRVAVTWSLSISCSYSWEIQYVHRVTEILIQYKYEKKYRFS